MVEKETHTVYRKPDNNKSDYNSSVIIINNMDYVIMNFKPKDTTKHETSIALKSDTVNWLLDVLQDIKQNQND